MPWALAAATAIAAIGLAAWVLGAGNGGLRRPLVASSPNHGRAASSLGSVRFSVDVMGVDRTDDHLVLHLRFQNTSTEQQRADPSDFRLEAATGWRARPVFDASCRDWGRVDLQPPGASSQPLRDAGGTRAASSWEGDLCFPTPPAGSGLTLIWEPDVAFGPLSRQTRIAIRE